MDPNANLAEMREITRDILADYQEGTIDDAARLAELIEAMDEWLSEGGFLPGDWSR